MCTTLRHYHLWRCNVRVIRKERDHIIVCLVALVSWICGSACPNKLVQANIKVGGAPKNFKPTKSEDEVWSLLPFTTFLLNFRCRAWLSRIRRATRGGYHQFDNQQQLIKKMSRICSDLVSIRLSLYVVWYGGGHLSWRTGLSREGHN